MAIYPSPTLILVPALLLNVGLAVAGFWGRKPAAGAGKGFVYAGLAALVILAAASLALFPGWDRAWPVLLGVLLGVGLGVLLEWALADSAGTDDQAGALGAGLAALALLALLVGEPVGFANAALGLVWGWGTLQLVRVVAWPQATGAVVSSGLALATTAVVGAAAAWGEKLAPGAALGAPLAIALGTSAGLALLAGRLAEGRLGRPWLGAVVSAVLFAVLALMLMGGPYAQPWSLWGAVAAGGLFGVVAAALTPREGPVPPAVSLALLVVAGVLLILDNRLMGILGIGLGGIGLALGSRGPASVRPLVVLLVTIFAARTWLQLFLDRTLLSGYGVDLTHPYAFAALIVGGLLPWAALTIGRLTRGEPVLAVAWAIAVALTPVWIGYFVHVEALGSLLAGLVMAAFLLGAARQQEGDNPDVEAAPAAAALLMAGVASTLLAAPWLVSVMNATRQERLVMLLAGVVVVLIGFGVWWARVARRAPHNG